MDVIIAVWEGIGAQFAHLYEKEKEEDGIEYDDGNGDALFKVFVVAEGAPIAGFCHYSHKQSI